jgi:hypothetical protein
LKKIELLLVLVMFCSVAFSQHIVSGKISDKKDNYALMGVNVVALNGSDSTFVKGAPTDDSGAFEISLPNGNYILKVSYTGYRTSFIKVDVASQNVQLGTIVLSEDVRELSNVVIEQLAKRGEQKGDTTEFNANAFKTNPDATTEDLVAKMPGVTIENGTVKARGEDVKRVLVDGKPFFGNDPSTVLKNMPADVVDKVQVFDKGSDQAQFTGFSDGNEERTINIVTKPGSQNGVFGKVYAGYGYLDAHRYSAGANVNWFNGNRRVSFLGMSNNINQQNFAIEDILGVSGNSGGGGGRRGMMPMGGRGNPAMMMNSSAGNFMVGQQGGISTTHAFGFNYSDQWSNKVKFTGSYFFNYTNNINRSETARTFFSQSDVATKYDEQTESQNKNINHRINMRIEYAIDSNNSLFFTPKLTVQQNNQLSITQGANALTDGNVLSGVLSDYESKNIGFNFSGNVLYQHKFKKVGRTLSIDLTGTTNNNNGEANLLSLNTYTSPVDTVSLDQYTEAVTSNYSVSGNVAYTEPVGQLGQMQFNYAPSYSWNMKDKSTYDADTVSGEYNAINNLLSSNFDNNYMSHKVGATYLLRDKSDKMNFSISTNVQYALLTGVQEFPTQFTVRKTFNNFLPNASFRYKISQSQNFRFHYNTSTSAPSINQLQNVIDNGNPLLLSTGNSSLKQSYQHSARMHYSNMNMKTMHMFFTMLSFNYTQNYIGNSTLIAVKDTLLSDGVLLNAGAQLSKPVNLSGSLNLRSFFTYGLPVRLLKSNFNANVGVTYSRTPSLLNGRENLSNSASISGGFVLSSNFSQKIDFTIMYNANYNIVRNSLQSQSNNNYFFHNAEAKFNWMFWKGFVFNTSLNNTLYRGVGTAFNQNFFLWNAALGYKFLKDKSLEMKASVFDILGQNNSVSRTVNDAYVEDVRTDVLQRYVMLTVTYNLRYFKKKADGDLPRD